MPTFINAMHSDRLCEREALEYKKKNPFARSWFQPNFLFYGCRAEWMNKKSRCFSLARRFPSAKSGVRSCAKVRGDAMFALRTALINSHTQKESKLLTSRIYKTPSRRSWLKADNQQFPNDNTVAKFFVIDLCLQTTQLFLFLNEDVLITHNKRNK